MDNPMPALPKKTKEDPPNRIGFCLVADVEADAASPQDEN